MVALTAATIAATAAVAGTAIAGASAYGQYEAQKDASAASKQAEALRRQQLELDNRRRMTQLIRESAIARSRSVSAASAQGITNSSLAEGGASSIQSQTGANVLAQAENVGIGRGLFDANAAYSEARASAQNWASGVDLGKTIFQNSERIGQIGETLYASKSLKTGPTRFPDAGYIS